MCGILGLVSDGPLPEPPLLAEMRDRVTHRGPDGAGSWYSEDGAACLAHRRLAIIDLSSGGDQPMVDPTGQVCLTFNGEIYNYRELRRELARARHRFRSESDTEVLLAAYLEWGTDCLPRLHGMFAFGVYDARSRSLFLARDRAGEKPLFYLHDGHALWFASELKSLMANPRFPRRLDVASLDDYLALGYVPGERCLLNGVRKLTQGSGLVFHVPTQSVRTWTYWSLPEDGGPPRADAAELTTSITELLREAVAAQLVADVPVGVLLSGGLDSSLVTAVAADVSSRPVRTFTIAFPGHGSYDEGPHARLVASHFGTEHTELVAEPSTVDLLPTLARQYDEPIADSSMVPTFLVSRLIREHAKVALGGDGGDELFAGYGHYPWLVSQAAVRRLVPGPVRGAAAALAGHLPVGFKGRNHLIGFRGDDLDAIAHVNLYFDARTRRRLLAPLGQVNPGRAPEEVRRGLARRTGTIVEKATSADFRSYLVDDILVKVDRASMLASLEVRSPLLDHRMVEFAFSRLPSALRATRTERKVLLKRLARNLLPDAFDVDRKQGFSLPLGAWFKGEWGDAVADVLTGATQTVFDRSVLAELLDGQRRGYSNTQRLFSLMMFELWRDAYKVTM